MSSVAPPSDTICVNGGAPVGEFLSDEYWWKILEYIPLRDLLELRAVNVLFRAIITTFLASSKTFGKEH